MRKRDDPQYQSRVAYSELWMACYDAALAAAKKRTSKSKFVIYGAIAAISASRACSELRDKPASVIREAGVDCVRKAEEIAREMVGERRLRR